MKASGFVKDPWSAYTHAIGLALTCVAAVPLLIKASGRNDPKEMRCMLVFILSMVLLYAASTIYHTLDLGEKKNRILQRLDHSAIFLLPGQPPPRLPSWPSASLPAGICASLCGASPSPVS